MSASVGNVVATWEWPLFAPPQILRLLFLKRPNKVRDFSYEYIPKYVDEFYKLQRIYFGKEEDDKEEFLKRLYVMSEVKVPDKMPAQIPFDYAALVSQLVPKEKMLEKAIELFRSTGHLKKVEDEGRIKEILIMAKNWAERYGGESYKIKILKKPASEKLNEKQKQALKILADDLKEEMTEEELYARFFEIKKEVGIDSKEFFKAIYLSLLGKPWGPRLAPFILIIGRERVRKLLNQA
jgi:lysyl-tRNA synthetase class 1